MKTDTSIEQRTMDANQKQKKITEFFIKSTTTTVQVPTI